MLPTVFTIEKGNPIASKAIGPGALYVIEGDLYSMGINVILTMSILLGEFIVEDAAHPETQLHLTAGDVILVDEGTVEKISSPSKGRGELSRPSNFRDRNLYTRNA